MLRSFIPLLLVLFIPIALCSQNLSFSKLNPGPSFQDADVGAMAMADVDADGDKDIMITGKGGPVKSTLYKNDGTGNFTEVSNAPFEDVFGGWLAFSDIDGDSDLDLLITGNTQGAVRSAKLYTNDGSGNYTLVVGTPLTPCWGGQFAFGDIDGDGDDDIIYTGANAQSDPLTELYLNNGAGVFTQSSNTPFADVMNSAVAFVDHDNDNDLDILIAGENGNGNPETSLYTNDGTGNFSIVSNMPFDDISNGDIAIADSDNDGDDDILISGMTGNSTITKLYLNNGSGSFSVFSNTPFEPSSVGATLFSDLDNDGDQDVLITGSGNMINALIYENLGGNNYANSDTLDGAYLSCAAIGDIDGDNDKDIVIGGTTLSFPIRGTKTYSNTTPNIGLSQINLAAQITLFPNPTSGFFQISFTGIRAKHLKIYNMRGQLVKQIKSYNSGEQISLNQPAGSYLIELIVNGQTISKKIILK